MNAALQEHLGYVADVARVERFRAALTRVVKPGDRVADLGCGTGLLGLLCLRAGAAHVDFVDHGPLLEVARQTVARAGLSHRASFIAGRSQRVELPARVDVVVCDHVGYFGFDYNIIPLLKDARRRFLRPGGILVPTRLTLHIAAIESERCRALVEAWTAKDVPPDFHWLRECAINSTHAAELAPGDLLGAPAALGHIDMSEDQPEYRSWTARLPIERDGVLHGLAGWFDCELADGIRVTNSPVSDQRIRRPQAFLPIDSPLDVRAGEAITAAIRARLFDQSLAWTVEFDTSGRRTTHSTLRGMLLSRENLVAADPDRRPRLTREARARVTVLRYCDGRRSLGDIEQAIRRDHPELFPSSGEISRFVAVVLGRDTE